MANYIKDLRAKVGSQPIILVGATVLVFNEKGEVLLQHRSDSDDWGFPGGALELGETLGEAARRELFEETGLETENLELCGVFSGEEFYYRYPNGDESYNVIVLYQARGVTGDLQMNDGESLALAYFSRENYPKLEKRAETLLRMLAQK